jgi:type VI secretion system protein ImpF
MDPNAGGGRGYTGFSPQQMELAVRRDLEDLLNTRQSHSAELEEFEELRNSIMAYGVPDLPSIQVVTPQDREKMARLLEAIIARFEPRLRNIQVILLKSNEEKSRRLRFRIDATLSMDPAPPVAFDTLLELGTGHYSVQSTEIPTTPVGASSAPASPGTSETIDW